MRRVPFTPCHRGWSAEQVADKQFILHQLLSAHPTETQDSILYTRTHGYHYADHCCAAHRTRAHGLEYAHTHARWWIRQIGAPQGWTYCNYADVCNLVQQPETDSFEARFHRIYSHIYRLHPGQCVDPLPRSNTGRWYRPDDGLPMDGRPIDEDDSSSSSSSSSSGAGVNSIPAEQSASLPPPLSGSEVEALYDGDSGSEAGGAISPRLPLFELPAPLFPHRDPSTWCVIGVFVGSNICPNVPFWVPLLVNQEQLQPLSSLQVSYRTMMAALRLGAQPTGAQPSATVHPSSSRLFFVRLVQRVQSNGDRYGLPRYLCDDIARSYGVTITLAQWVRWHPISMQIRTPEVPWTPCLSFKELKYHILRINAETTFNAVAHPVFGPIAHTFAAFLQAVRKGFGINAYCAPRPMQQADGSSSSSSVIPRLSALPHAWERMLHALSHATEHRWWRDRCPDSIYPLSPPPSPPPGAAPTADESETPPALSLDIDFIAVIEPCAHYRTAIPAVILCHRSNEPPDAPAAAHPMQRPMQRRLRTPPPCLDESEDEDEDEVRKRPSAKRPRTAPVIPPCPAAAAATPSALPVSSSSQPAPTIIAAPSPTNPRTDSPLLLLELEEEEAKEEQEAVRMGEVDLDFELD